MKILIVQKLELKFSCLLKFVKCSSFGCLRIFEFTSIFLFHDSELLNIDIGSKRPHFIAQ